MAEREDVARIRTYLEEHRATYTQAALRAKLLEDGHNQEAVDLAMAQVYGFAVPPASPQPAENTRTRVILIAAGTFLANYILLPAIVVAIITVVDQGGAGFGPALASFGIIPVVLLFEGLAAFLLRGRDRTIARGLGWGVVASLLPLIGLALLFGVCFALITTLSG
jgi:hypothetical protein